MFLAGKVLESMPYADAVIKEALRVHPIVASLFRRTLQVRKSPAGFPLCWQRKMIAAINPRVLQAYAF